MKSFSKSNILHRKSFLELQALLLQQFFGPRKTHVNGKPRFRRRICQFVLKPQTVNMKVQSPLFCKIQHFFLIFSPIESSFFLFLDIIISLLLTIFFDKFFRRIIFFFDL